MREILFRAFVKDKEKIFDVKTIDFSYKFITFEEENKPTDTMRMLDQIELMQYTGLTDKNETKIFEGDIVKHGILARSVVEYGWGKFIAHRLFRGKEFASIDDYNNGEFMDLIEATWGEIEVIGNIYDNPELLEVKDVKD